MNKTTLFVLSGASAVLTLLAIFFLDRPIAESIRASGFENAWAFSHGTSLLDSISGENASKFLVGFVLICGSGALFMSERMRAYGVTWLFIGLVQLLNY